MIKSKLVIVLILVINCTLSFAQKPKENLIRFTGVLKDADNQKNNWVMHIAYNTADQFNSVGASNIITPKIDSIGRFNFVLPNLNKAYRITLVIYQNTNGITMKNKIYEDLYFVEPNDNIHVNIVLELDNKNRSLGNSLIFSGKGSEKYNLAWSLQNSFYREYYKDLSNLGIEDAMDSVHLTNTMERLSSLIRIYQIRKSNIINASNLSSEMRKIINYEYGAYRFGLNNEWRYRCQNLYNKYPKFQEKIAETYFRNSELFYKKPDTIAKICTQYLEEQLLREIFEYRIKHKLDLVNIDSIYNIVTIKYAGVVKERIVGFMLTNARIQRHFMPSNENSMVSLLRNALAFSKLPYIKETLHKRIIELNHFNENIIFNGQFTTLSNENFELKSLHGKVILLDIWFNGCWGCAEFHKNFKKIYPKFKDNKDFIVLSVNVDKEKKRWIDGIESKLYTSKDFIQVTTGSWFDHPFMNYYNIRGASYVMLINREGKILPMAKTFEELSTQIGDEMNNKLNQSK